MSAPASDGVQAVELAVFIGSEGSKDVEAKALEAKALDEAKKRGPDPATMTEEAAFKAWMFQVDEYKIVERCKLRQHALPPDPKCDFDCGRLCLIMFVVLYVVQVCERCRWWRIVWGICVTLARALRMRKNSQRSTKRWINSCRMCGQMRRRSR